MSAPVRMTVAAAMATALAALTLWPVFATQPWLVPAWAAIGLVAGTGWVLRRLPVPRILVPLGQLIVLLEAFLLSAVPDAMAWLVLPTPGALAALGERVGDGFAAMAHYAPPVPAEPGLVVLACGGIAALAVAVDSLAVTWPLVPWTGLPLLAAYAVPAAVIRGGLPWFLFIPIAAGYVVLLVAEGHGRVARWGRPVGGTERRGPVLHTAALTTTGRRVGSAVIALAVVVPAVLPALPEGVFGTGSGGGGGPGGRVISTDNPIVDLRRDLVRPDNVEILRFRTNADRPEYIRLVALDDYDGRLWKASRRAVPEEQRVDNGLPEAPGLTDEVPRTEARTQFQISDSLDVRWLPLTYPTTAIDIGGDWRYDRGTLDVVGSDRRTAGERYLTTSLVLTPTVESLQQAGDPPSDLAPLLAVPRDTGRVIDGALADALRGKNPASKYEAAVDVQGWFRDTFTYSTARRAGNSDSALSSFLADQSGYCEQFAATMALMARQLGIPARVAVGFLPGTQASTGEWVVRANDAHAWPELYFEGVGWVRFEPTPPNRTGNAPAWTTPVGAPTGVSSAAASGPESSRSRSVIPQAGLNAGTGSGGEVQAVDSTPWGRIAVAATVLLAVALTPALGMLARRRRWRHADGSPVAEAEVAWAELRDAVRDGRGTWDPARTPRGTAAALGSQARLPTAARAALVRIAAAVEHARYAPSTTQVGDLRQDVAVVREALLARQPERVRWQARLLPVAGRDLLARIVGLGGSALDAASMAGYRVRQRLPFAR